jgi:hypothetical protein
LKAVLVIVALRCRHLWSLGQWQAAPASLIDAAPAANDATRVANDAGTACQ